MSAQKDANRRNEKKHADVSQQAPVLGFFRLATKRQRQWLRFSTSTGQISAVPKGG